MTKEYDNTNTGAIFKDQNKKMPEDRDYSGSLDVEGREYWVSGRLKTSKQGVKFISLSIKAKDAAPAKAPFNDDIGI